MKHLSTPNYVCGSPAQDGATALHMASQNGHARVVQALLEAGADPTVNSVEVSRFALSVCVRVYETPCSFELL